MTHIHLNEDVGIPPHISRCPECGSLLTAGVEDCEGQTGKPKKVCVECLRDTEHICGDKIHHLHNKETWQETIDTVRNYVAEHYVVVQMDNRRI